jgi:hypothetical protein
VSSLAGNAGHRHWHSILLVKTSNLYKSLKKYSQTLLPFSVHSPNDNEQICVTRVGSYGLVLVLSWELKLVTIQVFVAWFFL